MSDTTPKLELNVPAANTPNWDILLNENFYVLDDALILGANNSLALNSLNGIRFADQFDSIQDAIDDLPATGGRVFIPAGTYVENISTDKPNLELIGMGNVGAELSGNDGATIISVSSGVGFTFNSAGTSTIFQGPTLRNISFLGQSGATGGVRILRSNNFLLDNIRCYGFTDSGSYAFFIDGTGNVDQYGTLLNCKGHKSNIGLKRKYDSGIRLIGCHFDGNQNGGDAIVTGSFGILGDTGSGSMMAVGTIIQGFDYLIQLNAGENDCFVATRLENFKTAAINLTTANGTNIGVQFLGGSINNYINGSIGTAILIGTGVDRSRFDFQHIAAVGTTITNSGTNTIYNLDGEFLFNQGTSGSLQLSSSAPTTGGTNIAFGNGTATTVGAAGGASALPATPRGYLIINVGGTNRKIPYYDS